MVTVPFSVFTSRPPLCAVVCVTFIITPVVVTNGMLALTTVEVDFFEHPVFSDINNKKDANNKMLRKPGIFMRINR